MRQNIQALQGHIKELVKRQIITKANRKTVKISVERTIEAEEAAWKVPINRAELREHYIAYAVLRGKDPKDHLGSSTLEEFTGVVNILAAYNEEVVCVDEE